MSMHVRSELAFIRLKAATANLSEALSGRAPEATGVGALRRPPAAFGGALTPYAVRRALGLPATSKAPQARGLVAFATALDR
jgi:hypothetical protein